MHDPGLHGTHVPLQASPFLECVVSLSSLILELHEGRNLICLPPAYSRRSEITERINANGDPKSLDRRVCSRASR